MMKYVLLISMGVVLVAAVACTKEKVKPWAPLILESSAKSDAKLLTEQGAQAYQSRQFEDAKKYFSQAMAAAAQSGAAHYNYALALQALGDKEQARQQFLEAANLAPGDKVIWDSPALRPFTPEMPKAAHKEHPTGTSKPGMGSGPR